MYEKISYPSAWRVCGNNNAPDAFRSARYEKLAVTTVAASDMFHKRILYHSLFEVNVQRA